MEAIQQIIEANVINAAKEIESQIDSELHKLENLKEDDIDSIRKRRVEEMKRMAQKKQEWVQKGHGEYRDVHDEKQFFAEMKGEERMVAHFYREGNWPCKVIDKHMGILATKHLETKFIRINAEKSPFLTERLKIWMLPTLALVKSEKTIGYIVGLDEMGGSDDFPTEALAVRLARDGLVNWDGDAYGAKKAAGDAPNLRKGFSNQRTESDEDSDFD